MPDRWRSRNLRRGRPVFGRLRYGRQPQTEAVLFAFDLLELGRKDLRRAPLEERKGRFAKRSAADAASHPYQSRRGGSRTRRYAPHSRLHRAAIDRLNQHRPDLAARIRAKKMSANAAAIPSGSRGRLAIANCTSSRAVHSIGAAQALLTVGP
jgi:hypothetical protein